MPKTSKGKSTRGKGRPRTVEISTTDIAQIEAMAGLGLNLDQMSNILGMSPRTLDRRIAEDKEKMEAGKPGTSNIYGAIEKGRAKGDLKLTQSAFNMATSGKHPVMTIFLCKVRLGWRENAGGTDDKEFKLAYTAGDK